jgi:hypothetical protein
MRLCSALREILRDGVGASIGKLDEGATTIGMITHTRKAALLDHLGYPTQRRGCWHARGDAQ